MDSQREGIKALAREAALIPKEELLQVKAGSQIWLLVFPKRQVYKRKELQLHQKPLHF